jgi:hypothetical protein
MSAIRMHFGVSKFVASKYAHMNEPPTTRPARRLP